MLKLWMKHVLFEKCIDVFFSNMIHSVITPNIPRHKKEFVSAYSSLFEAYSTGYLIHLVVTPICTYKCVKVIDISMMGIVKVVSTEMIDRYTGQVEYDHESYIAISEINGLIP